MIHHGDCLDILPTLDAESVDACVTDPPYGLAFMGKAWDHGVPGEPYWREVSRVLKPGGHLLAFGGTRTHHRLMVAIEDAGFEIRDCLMWLYGSGFPKSLDVSKAIDKAAGAERQVIGENPLAAKQTGQENTASHGDRQSNLYITAPATDAAQQWAGWGTALKPAWEPIILARKPLAGTVAATVLMHGTGALNVDGCRIGTGEDLKAADYDDSRRQSPKFSGILSHGKQGEYRRSPGTVPAGRWPANVCLDEEAARLLDEQSGERPGSPKQWRSNGKRSGTSFNAADDGSLQAPMDRFGYGDTGGASRFFYTAKASRSERGAYNDHPTVKPLALMRWLVRLVTPSGGVVLDPFLGSGTTALACQREGFGCIGIERDEHSVEIALRRLEQTTLPLDVAI